MRKQVNNIVVVLLIAVLLLSNTINAKAAGVALTGPNVVRAGDTIKVNIIISDAGRNAIEGTFSYDSNILTLSSVTSAMAGWKVETNGNIIMAYDENMSNPTNANAVIAVATFKVKSDVTEGTAVNISLQNTSVAAGSSSYDIGTVTYSVNIAKPLSGENRLSAIEVNGYKLSPSFNEDNTSYDIGEVEYSVSNIIVKATQKDASAKVSVSGNNLVVGENTISILVKAENGSTKTYKIKVTRKQNPNYIPSNNANIKTLKVSQGVISPAFSAENKNYVIYLSYESVGNKFEVSGTAADSKSLGVEKGVIDSLKEGTNITYVKCTAEDGTINEYKINVVVMPKYQGVLPKIEGVEEVTEEITTEEVTTEETTTEEVTTEEITTVINTENEDNKENDNALDNNGNDDTGVSVGVTVVIAIVAMLIGAGGCFLIMKGVNHSGCKE